MTQEQEARLKEIGERVEDSREFLGDIHPGAMQDRLFLYDLLLQTIAERDEARKLCSDYRDTYGGGPKDPLPWEAKDV